MTGPVPAPPIVNTELGVVLIGGYPYRAQRARLDGVVHYWDDLGRCHLAQRDVTRDSFIPEGGAA